VIKRISIGVVALLLLAGCADPTETVQPKGDTVELQGGQQIFVQKIEVNG